MLTVITYDVNTEDAVGQKRLRKVAKHCVNYGQRVQNSVFECIADAATMAKIKAELLEIADLEKDSLRFITWAITMQGRSNIMEQKPHTKLKDS